MVQAFIFSSVGGAVGPISFNFYNQKVSTRIHVRAKFHEIWTMFSVKCVLAEDNDIFGNSYYATLCTSSLCGKQKLNE